jgi:RNA polymerase sigma-70 factor, ECF subfamily
MPHFALSTPNGECFAPAQGERVSMGAHLDHIPAEALFREHGKYVARFLWQLGLAEQDIDDAVQDVFMVVHRRGGFRPGAAKPTTWLAEIAVRVARARRRRTQARRTEPQEAMIAALEAPGPSPHEAAAQSQSLARVQQALQTLDVDRRAVFVLAEIFGESCEDIASSLGIAVGTVYSRLNRARDKFRKAYERLNREGNA